MTLPLEDQKSILLAWRGRRQRPCSSSAPACHLLFLFVVIVLSCLLASPAELEDGEPACCCPVIGREDGIGFGSEEVEVVVSPLRSRVTSRKELGGRVGEDRVWPGWGRRSSAMASLCAEPK